jgi:hypothetical protein
MLLKVLGGISDVCRNSCYFLRLTEEICTNSCGSKKKIKFFKPFCNFCVLMTYLAHYTQMVWFLV